MSNRFGKFTERSRKVLGLAQEEAQRLKHPYVGTEHILIALRREDSSIAAKALAQLGLTVEQLRRAIEDIIKSGDTLAIGQVGLTADAKVMIEQAVAEAQRLNHSYIGTEHLLLGLTLVKVDNRAKKILQHLNVSLDAVRDAVMEQLSHNPPSQSTSVFPPLSRPSSTSPMPGSPHLYIPPIESTVDDLKQNALFSTQLIQDLLFAQDEALSFQHPYIGTEHQLLGLLRDTESNATKVLNDLGVDLQKARDAVMFIIGRGDHIPQPSGPIRFTPRAKKVLEISAATAQELKSDKTQPVHLLLGLVYEGEGIAAGVLESLGASREKVREATIRVLAQESEDTDKPDESNDNSDLGA